MRITTLEKTKETLGEEVTEGAPLARWEPLMMTWHAIWNDDQWGVYQQRTLDDALAEAEAGDAPRR